MLPVFQFQEEGADGAVRDCAERDGSARPERGADCVIEQEAAQARSGVAGERGGNRRKAPDVLGNDQRWRTPARIDAPCQADKESGDNDSSHISFSNAVPKRLPAAYHSRSARSAASVATSRTGNRGLPMSAAMAAVTIIGG